MLILDLKISVLASLISMLYTCAFTFIHGSHLLYLKQQNRLCIQIPYDKENLFTKTVIEIT